MDLFRQPKPRPFHLEPRFADELRQRLKEVEKRARAQLGLDADEPLQDTSARDRLHGAFAGSATRARQRNETLRRSWLPGLLLPLLLLCIAVIVLFLLL